MSIERRPERADFHVHYEPENIDNILERAQNENVVALGLISKLTIPYDNEVDTCLARAEEKGINAIMGIEINKPIAGSAVDLIALGFDHKHPDIKELFGKEERRQRSIEVAIHQEKVLEEEGFVISPQNSEEERILDGMRDGDINEKAIRYCGLVVGNPENKEKIEEYKDQHFELWNEIKENYVHGDYKDNIEKQTAKFLWFLYFQPGRRGHVPSPDTAKKIIESVHAAGGVVLYSPEGEYKNAQYNEFLEMGGDGIMAWHGGRLGEEPRKSDGSKSIPYSVIRETYKKGKLVLGGSDFDPQKDDWQVGVGEGNMYMSPRRYVNLQSYLGKNDNR